MILEPDSPRPQKLIVNWRSGGGPAGTRDCLLMTVRGTVRLNGSATEIWERVDGRHDPRQIASELREIYPGAEAEDLVAAVEELLDELVRLGAVVRDWRALDPCPVARVARPFRIPAEQLAGGSAPWLTAPDAAAHGG